MKLPSSAALVSLIVTAAVVLTSCRRRAEPTPGESLREITSPAGPDSGQPNLATGPAGETYLSWIETTETGSPALRFAVRKEQQWSQVQTIVQGDELLVNWADYPSLLPLEGGLLAAHWMTLVPDREGYNVNVAFSRDGGRTWSKPVVPHRDGTPTEHGFVSLAPAPGGGVGVIWLDSRKLSKAGGSAEVAMMYTNVSPDGKLGPEVPLDGRVCECCQPSAVRTANGILAVYRDRSENEIRDISIVRFDGKRWSEPKTVFEDRWEIYACPINGPAIASHENYVAVAWFTAPNDKPKVQLAFSTDGGNTFGPPIQIDNGHPMGRVDVVALDSRGAVVTWLELGDQEAEVRARRVEQDGTRYPSLAVGITSSGTFPRTERNGETALFAWTSTKNEYRVRVSVLDSKN